MNEKIREEMISAIEKALGEAGAPNYEDGIKTVLKLIDFLGDRVRDIQTTDDLRKALDACEPMSRSEERLALFAMQNLPALARVLLKMLAKMGASTFPPPPAGRPPAFGAHEREEVLNYIAELNRKGASLPAAKLRASQRYGRSRRTIDRLWSHRGDTAEDKPTIDAVISRIAPGE